MQYRYVAPSPLRGAKNVLPLNLREAKSKVFKSPSLKI